jgi:sugar phosphate isomerase/epimerase
MIVGGLVSVTFRQLSVNDIIELVTSTELSALEWGGDVHVPHGDIQCAVETRQKTEDAGLSVASYGSYYRVGHNEPVQYELVLDTAVALNAPIVRVWAGKRNAEDADPDYWHQVVEDSQRIAQLTSKAGKKIAYEYHQNTLTNTLKSTLRLLNAVGHEAVTSYWQAPSTATLEGNLSALEDLQPWLSNIHINTNRKPLIASLVWKRYLMQISSTGRKCFALIEFVKNDNPQQFIQDAITLTTWLQDIESKI